VSATLLGLTADDVVAQVKSVQDHVDDLAARAPDWRRKQDLQYLRRRPQPLFTGVPTDGVKRLELGQDRLPKYVQGDHAYPVFLIRDTSERRYPQGSLAAHVLGFMGPVNNHEYNELGYRYSYAGDEMKKFFPDDLIGRAGIEERYESVLRGARGHLYALRDVHGRPLPDQPSSRDEPHPGQDLRLSIDSRIQRFAEQALDEQIARLAADTRAGDPPLCGAAVFLDPSTGDVLAAASSPRFDPNTVQEDYGKLRVDPRMPFFPRATQGRYPVGSTFKIVVATAALEEGLINGYTEFTCHGTFPAGDRTLKCTSAHGTLELTAAIEQSCNVYFWNTGLIVGAKRLKTWAERLGLGARTGVDLSDAAGQVPLGVSRGDVLNLSIGQGAILCTPLQIARLAGCIGTAGKLAEPRFSLDKPVRVEFVDLHPDRISALRRGMHDVVEGSRGTARNTGAVEGLVYAAKTGTAQTPRADIYDSWFAGYAPFHSPAVSFACIIENTHEHGGVAAAPVVQRVFSRMMLDARLSKYFSDQEEQE
jgi:penicillin-binding protein 2